MKGSQINQKNKQFQKQQKLLIQEKFTQQQYYPISKQLESSTPALNSIKPDALQHDIKLGWMPRSQVTGPIPLSFSHQDYDWIIQQKKQKIIYLGYRPSNTFQLHQKFYQNGKKYPFNQFHLCKAKFLQRFFKNYYGDYIFEGRSSQSFPHEVQFNSQFEGGNLDAVYFEQNEYRLIVRVDSNTVGHCTNYNFKLKIKVPGKYTFRIMNIHRGKSLYLRGMKPYIKKINNQLQQFQQGGINVKFSDSPLVQQFQLGINSLKSLKFDLITTEIDQQYQISYAIPYNYSDLLAQLRSINNNSFHLGKLCHSLSGVEIPLITISAENQQQKQNKFVIVLTSRVHPSEASSSHIISGAIKYLLSQNSQAKYLRNRVIFKIIPMLNPDGAIVGNTRTGFAGKDLNRQYKKKSNQIFPQINGIMDYVDKLKQKYQNKLLFVIDIHGHSARKNSFFYGPQFPIIDQQYSKCRLLPKLYAYQTQIFRYYSCKFKVATSKQATARGYFNNRNIRTYTHQTSAHCYFDFKTRKDTAFTRKTLNKLGVSLCLTFYQYLELLFPRKVNNNSEQIQINKKKIQYKTTSKQIQIYQQCESDKQSSANQDSEGQNQDFQQKKMLVFFNKINQNKEYFYEQLMKMNQDNQIDNPNLIDKKKTKTKQEQYIKQNRQQQLKHINLQAQLLIKQNNSQKKIINWAQKVTYTNRKKQYVQYPRLSNVIFGSTIPQKFLYQRKSVNIVSKLKSQNQQFLNTKYSIKYIEAKFKQENNSKNQFQAQKLNNRFFKRQQKQKYNSCKIINNNYDLKIKRQYRLSEKIQHKRDDKRPKVLSFKLSDLKLADYIQSANKITEQKQINKTQLKHENIKLIPVKSLQYSKSKQKSNNDSQSQDIMRISNTLKVLKRKKSIKSFKNNQNLPLQNKFKKKDQANQLIKKLPSLGIIYQH